MNGKEVLKTDWITDINVVHMNHILKPTDFSKDPIPKTTTITIQVWDQNTFSADDLVQETTGDIDDYIKEPLRKGYETNLIETSTIWVDEVKNV